MTEPRSAAEPFHFSLSLGQYIDLFASDAKELADIIEVAPTQSLEFHMERHDFEAWLRSIGAKRMALAIETVGNESLSGEDLRKGLLKAVQDLQE